MIEIKIEECKKLIGKRVKVINGPLKVVFKEVVGVIELKSEYVKKGLSVGIEKNYPIGVIEGILEYSSDEDINETLSFSNIQVLIFPKNTKILLLEDKKKKSLRKKIEDNIDTFNTINLAYD